MERSTADGALEAIVASAAALIAVVPGAVVPGAESAGACVPDPLRAQADRWLDSLQEACRLQAATAAFIVHAAAGFADATRAMSPPDEQPHQRLAQEIGIVSEVACVMTVSERTSSALLGQSRELIATLPLTLGALQKGSMSWQHARAMVDEAASLDPAGAAALEAHFLDPDATDAAKKCPAGEMVASRFRAKARAWRERHHPESIEKRHAKGFLDRRLDYAPDRDGMAWLSAYLPADQAAGIWDRTTSAARALQGPTEGRTLTQLRADVAATWLLTPGRPDSARTGNACTDTSRTGTVADSLSAARAPAKSDAHGVNAKDVLTGPVPSPAAQVLVTVPVFALMGLTDEPATLDGYGPIPASMARNLVAEGASSFHRVLVDPRDGAPLEIGRSSYRIPPAMRQWLRLRDRKCSFPGCNNQSLDNEGDHILAWADGGTTGISNLGQLCRKHHRLKHNTAWTPTGASNDKPPGWTSPAGRHYASEHHDWEPPHWPPQILDQVQGYERGQAMNDRSGPDRETAEPEQSGPDRRPVFPALNDAIP